MGMFSTALTDGYRIRVAYCGSWPHTDPERRPLGPGLASVQFNHVARLVWSSGKWFHVHNKNQACWWLTILFHQSKKLFLQSILMSSFSCWVNFKLNISLVISTTFWPLLLHKVWFADGPGPDGIGCDLQDSQLGVTGHSQSHHCRHSRRSGAPADCPLPARPQCSGPRACRVSTWPQGESDPPACQTTCLWRKHGTIMHTSWVTVCTWIYLVSVQTVLEIYTMNLNISTYLV